MSDEIIEGEVEMKPLAVQSKPAQGLEAWTPRFVAGVDDAIAAVAEKKRFFQSVMREGEHYGTIPGAGSKPTLLKPGAELLLANMGLRVELADAEPPVRDYGDEDREGMISYRRVARIYRQTGALEHERMLIAQAEGFCSSRETKYRWRESKRKCPDCGIEAIIKGKAEYGGGWLCFKKQGGCGAKFMDGDPVIEAQTVGRVPNPDLADTENTILKMADKRAVVAATLLATGCSDIFTQDVEDGESWPAGAHETPRTTQNTPQPQNAQPAPKEPAKRAPQTSAEAKNHQQEFEEARVRLNDLIDQLTAPEKLRAKTMALGNPAAKVTTKEQVIRLARACQAITDERNGIAPGNDDNPEENLFECASETLAGGSTR